MTIAVPNAHGRRATRGLRPWLLIPKVLAVSVYFGGLTTAAMLWFTGPRPGAGDGKPDAAAAALTASLRGLFIHVIVPALLAAVLFGVLLFLQHPRVFARLRWWQVKIVIVLLGVPSGHFYMSSRLRLLREAWAGGVSNAAAERQISWGFVLALTVSAGVIVLGRQKPRLGQNWARAYPQSQPGE